MGGPAPGDIDVVIPTLGRGSLRPLVSALDGQRGRIGQILLVDDRPGSSGIEGLDNLATVLRGSGRGPAAARNLGWQASEAEWIAFLDDDVVPAEDWAERLVADLRRLGPATAGSLGHLRVPLPRDRRPNDWERDVAGLTRARWITADIAYRRRALASVGGFDERFPGAYREDTDLAMRLLRAGWQIAGGERVSEHPVPPASYWASVGRQRGKADDVLMRAAHGRDWRRWGAAPPGRFGRHLPTAALGLGALASLGARRSRTAALLAAGWLAMTGELASARILPGPRDRDEVGRMLLTSIAIPFAASAWGAWGLLRLPAMLARGGPRGTGEEPPPSPPEAVLLDRDGTLLHDVPHNGDPARVEPMPGARRALRRLRKAGLPLMVISNQSGVARGLIDARQVEAVNRRAEELLGPVDGWIFCPHGPKEGCACRKPRPGMVVEAARRLGVEPERCVMIGDIAADVQAAQAAGAAAVLVPTACTAAEDVRRAPRREPSIEAAVAGLLGEADRSRR